MCRLGAINLVILVYVCAYVLAIEDCPTSSYICNDGKTCIPQSYVCNNETDCPGRDDEQDCGKYALCPTQ